MKRIVFSIYIDIPESLLDAQPPHHGETEDKNVKAKREFANHYEWLLERQKEYANNIGADYNHYVYDQKYIDLQKWYNTNYPYITEYNIVNFYKIHLMYELAEEYDEILYLDLDVLPVTSDNIFDCHDINKGVLIKKNSHHKRIDIDYIKKCEELFLDFNINSSIRSPWAKWWNSRALCMNYNKSTKDIPVYNTGIVGINKYWLDKIDYFNDFTETLEEMKELKEEDNSMWPKFVQAMFGWDNETIWGFKCHMNSVPSVWLDGYWHMFLDKNTIVPKESKLIHIVNKEFKAIREWYEENNI